MAEDISNYDDVTIYGLSPERQQELLDKQFECVFIWTNKAGHGIGVVMSCIFRDGSVWLTAARQRARIKAIQRDPRVSVVYSSTGTDMGPSKTITFKGHVTIHEDEATKGWFYPQFAAATQNPAMDAETFVKFLDTPDRVILEVVPEKTITFDGDKMVELTTQAVAAGEI